MQNTEQRLSDLEKTVGLMQDELRHMGGIMRRKMQMKSSVALEEAVRREVNLRSKHADGQSNVDPSNVTVLVFEYKDKLVALDLNGGMLDLEDESAPWSLWTELLSKEKELSGSVLALIKLPSQLWFDMNPFMADGNVCSYVAPAVRYLRQLEQAVINEKTNRVIKGFSKNKAVILESDNKVWIIGNNGQLYFVKDNPTLEQKISIIDLPEDPTEVGFWNAVAAVDEDYDQHYAKVKTVFEYIEALENEVKYYSPLEGSEERMAHWPVFRPWPPMFYAPGTLSIPGQPVVRTAFDYVEPLQRMSSSMGNQTYIELYNSGGEIIIRRPDGATVPFSAVANKVALSKDGKTIDLEDLYISEFNQVTCSVSAELADYINSLTIADGVIMPGSDGNPVFAHISLVGS